MMKMKTGIFKLLAVGACISILMSGCTGYGETPAQENSAETISITEEKEDTDKTVHGSGYVLKEVEQDNKNKKDKDVTDTDMSATERTRLDNLIDEIGKEIAE